MQWSWRWWWLESTGNLLLLLRILLRMSIRISLFVEFSNWGLIFDGVSFHSLLTGSWQHRSISFVKLLCYSFGWGSYKIVHFGLNFDVFFALYLNRHAHIRTATDRRHFFTDWLWSIADIFVVDHRRSLPSYLNIMQMLFFFTFGEKFQMFDCSIMSS